MISFIILLLCFFPVLLHGQIVGADTQRIGLNHTRITTGDGKKILLIQNGQNYFDPISNTYKKWDNKLTHNPDKKEWMHTKGRNFKADSNMVIYLNYNDAYITTLLKNTLTPKPQGKQEEDVIFWRNALLQTDWKVEQMPEGVRGTIIIKGNLAPLSFEFEHSFSGIPIEDRGAIYSDGLKINKPIAWDASGLSIPATMELSDPVDGFYTVTYTVDPSGGGFTYPYYLDPTITIDSAEDIHDTWFSQSQPDLDKNGIDLYIGSLSPGNIARIAVSVNLADSIPDGGTIDAARYIAKILSIAASPDATTRLYRLTPDSVDFAHSFGDWNHSDHAATQAWNTAGLGSGVDYLATHYDEIESKLVADELDTFNITVWVREIIEEDSVNFGFFLKSETESGSDYYNYYDMERSASDRPFVEVEYTPLPPPSPNIQRRNTIRWGRRR